MKKLGMVLLALLSVTLMVSCGGKYSKDEKVIEKSLKIMEDFSAELVAAGETKDGKVVAEVYSRTTSDSKLEEASENFDMVFEKYPKIDLGDPTTFPEDWEKLPGYMTRIEKFVMNIIGVMTTYGDDPDVQKVLEATE